MDRTTAFILLALASTFAPPARAQVFGVDGRIELAAAVRLAVEHSAELRYGRFDRSLAAARYRLAVRPFLPTVLLGYSQNDSVTYYTPDSRSRSVSVGLEQLVYTGGERVEARRRQRLEVEALGRELTAAEEELVLQVVDLYSRMLLLRRRQEILEEALGNTRAQADIAREELRLRTITGLDLLAIELAVKDLEIERAAADREEDELLFRFRELTGIGQEVRVAPVGEIDPQYDGFLERSDAGYYLAEAGRRSLELWKRQAQLADLRRALRRAEGSWIPRASARLDLSMSGDSFPLTRPGFSLGVDLGFGLPVLPSSAGLTVGRRGPLERSAGATSGVRIGEDLDGLRSVETARIRLARAAEGVEEFRRELEFGVRQALMDIEHRRRSLGLLREKGRLEAARLELEALMLELGEITRRDYVDRQIVLARLQIGILTSGVELYRREAALLRLCRPEELGRSHRSLILPELPFP